MVLLELEMYGYIKLSNANNAYFYVTKNAVEPHSVLFLATFFISNISVRKWYKNIQTSRHDHIEHILDASKT